MNKLETWLQSSDLSSQELGSLDEAEILKLLRAHDWNSELSQQKELEERGAGNCPAGVGVTDSDGWILHICPSSEVEALVHLHSKATRSLFGLITWQSPELHTAVKYPIADLPEAV